MKSSVQCSIYDICNNNHPERINHYKNLQDNIINWDCMKYPTGNNDITRLEETNEGIISINVYEEVGMSQDGNIKTIVLHRRTNILNAKYHIDLLRIYNG